MNKIKSLRSGIYVFIIALSILMFFGMFNRDISITFIAPESTETISIENVLGNEKGKLYFSKEVSGFYDPISQQEITNITGSINQEFNIGLPLQVISYILILLSGLSLISFFYVPSRKYKRIASYSIGGVMILCSIFLFFYASSLISEIVDLYPGFKDLSYKTSEAHGCGFFFPGLNALIMGGLLIGSTFIDENITLRQSFRKLKEWIVIGFNFIKKYVLIAIDFIKRLFNKNKVEVEEVIEEEK